MIGHGGIYSRCCWKLHNVMKVCVFRLSKCLPKSERKLARKNTGDTQHFKIHGEFFLHGNKMHFEIHGEFSPWNEMYLCKLLFVPIFSDGSHNLSNEKRAPGWLGYIYIGDEKLPSYIGIIINHCEDPYNYPVSWKIGPGFFRGSGDSWDWSIYLHEWLIFYGINVGK